MFDEFDEQTDLSFLNISTLEVEVSKKQAKSRRTPLSINGNSISVHIIADGIGKWNIGRKHSTEHRARLRETRIGKKVSDEARKRLIDGGMKRRGRVVSVETKAKISSANRGRIQQSRDADTYSRFTNSKIVMTPAGEFESQTLAALMYGVSRKFMGRLIRTHDIIGEGFYYVADKGKRPAVVKVKGVSGRPPKKVMTPAGVFNSLQEAEKFFNVTRATFWKWMREQPKHIYYIKD
jgi:hypothetical protein